MIKYYKKNAQMVGRCIGDEFILVPVRQHIGNLQSMYSLNPVGGFIWNLLETEKSVEELSEIIRKEYEIDDHNQVESDVIEFIDQLTEIGAVELTGDGD